MARRSSLLHQLLLACWVRGARGALQPVALRPAVLYVDPCNGDGLVEVSAYTSAVEECGATVIPMWSAAMAARMTDAEKGDGVYCAPAAGEELAWASEHLDGLSLKAVLCGSDGGLACAERLQHVLLPARSNGIDAGRRDKFSANEQLRSNGLPIARQAAPASWEAAKEFLEQLQQEQAAAGVGELRAVLKPRRGTASKGVFVARSLGAARDQFGVLSRSHVCIDTSEVDSDSRVVVQELLDGDEWIVDSVSRDGEHKIVALWRYDKGPANGAPFVYFCAELMAGSGEAESALMDYAMGA